MRPLLDPQDTASGQVPSVSIPEVGYAEGEGPRQFSRGKKDMKLINSDPRALGIANAEGTWDMNVFRAHINTCPECKQVSLYTLRVLAGFPGLPALRASVVFTRGGPADLP